MKRKQNIVAEFTYKNITIKIEELIAGKTYLSHYRHDDCDCNFGPSPSIGAARAGIIKHIDNGFL
jgi:hypothetical protein